jgi:hypothetical protein
MISPFSFYNKYSFERVRKTTLFAAKSILVTTLKKVSNPKEQINSRRKRPQRHRRRKVDLSLTYMIYRRVFWEGKKTPQEKFLWKP